MQPLLKGGEPNCCFTSVTLRRKKKEQSRTKPTRRVSHCVLFKKKKKLSSLGPFMSQLSSVVDSIPPLTADSRHVCFHLTCAAALHPFSIVSLPLPPAAVCSPLSPSPFRQPPRAILLRMFLPAVFSSSCLCFELLTPSTASL